MSTEKFTVRPAKNPKPNNPQWAVCLKDSTLLGEWEIATCWSELTAKWVSELMNAGEPSIGQEKLSEILNGHRLENVAKKISISS